REKPSRVLDGALFHIGFIDHAVVPFCDRRAGELTVARTEGVGRIPLGQQEVRVVEAAVGPAADGANSHPSSIESFCDPGWSGRCAIRCEASTMKRLMAFWAMASSSGMVKEWMGW